MLLERIEDDFRQAMKAHDAGRLSVLRQLRAAVTNAAIAARTSAQASLDEAAVETVLRQEVKKLKDALGDFTKAARHDLISATEAELKILQSYLPQDLQPSELKAIVDAVVDKLKADGVVEFGRAMGTVMREVKGRADGDTVGAAVRQALAERK
jgi:uncharacterized protein YqeY